MEIDHLNHDHGLKQNFGQVREYRIQFLNIDNFNKKENLNEKTFQNKRLIMCRQYQMVQTSIFLF